MKQVSNAFRLNKLLDRFFNNVVPQQHMQNETSTTYTKRAINILIFIYCKDLHPIMESVKFHFCSRCCCTILNK